MMALGSEKYPVDVRQRQKISAFVLVVQFVERQQLFEQRFRDVYAVHAEHRPVFGDQGNAVRGHLDGLIDKGP